MEAGGETLRATSARVHQFHRSDRQGIAFGRRFAFLADFFPGGFAATTLLTEQD
jgi:hypothetical protein